MELTRRAVDRQTTLVVLTMLSFHRAFAFPIFACFLQSTEKDRSTDRTDRQEMFYRQDRTDRQDKNIVCSLVDSSQVAEPWCSVNFVRQVLL